MEKKKILIADDEEQLHKMYSKFLSDEYDVLHAYDGAEALMVAVAYHPDIVILDVLMPIVDGRTICQRLKNFPKTEDIKIIILTGDKVEQHDRLIGFELGADDYIDKPCTREYLRLRIKHILRENPAVP